MSEEEEEASDDLLETSYVFRPLESIQQKVYGLYYISVPRVKWLEKLMLVED